MTELATYPPFSITTANDGSQRKPFKLAPAGVSRTSKPKQTIKPPIRPLIWSRESNQIVAGKPGTLQKFETQKYLMTLIVKACAAHSQIDNVQICLRKRPVLAGKGSRGFVWSSRQGISLKCDVFHNDGGKARGAPTDRTRVVTLRQGHL